MTDCMRTSGPGRRWAPELLPAREAKAGESGGTDWKACRPGDDVCGGEKRLRRWRERPRPRLGGMDSGLGRGCNCVGIPAGRALTGTGGGMPGRGRGI